MVPSPGRLLNVKVECDWYSVALSTFYDCGDCENSQYGHLGDTFEFFNSPLGWTGINATSSRSDDDSEMFFNVSSTISVPSVQRSAPPDVAGCCRFRTRAEARQTNVTSTLLFSVGRLNSPFASWAGSTPCLVHIELGKSDLSAPVSFPGLVSASRSLPEYMMPFYQPHVDQNPSCQPCGPLGVCSTSGDCLCGAAVNQSDVQREERPFDAERQFLYAGLPVRAEPQVLQRTVFVPPTAGAPNAFSGTCSAVPLPPELPIMAHGDCLKASKRRGEALAVFLRAPRSSRDVFLALKSTTFLRPSLVDWGASGSADASGFDVDGAQRVSGLDVDGMCVYVKYNVLFDTDRAPGTVPSILRRIREREPLVSIRGLGRRRGWVLGDELRSDIDTKWMQRSDSSSGSGYDPDDFSLYGVAGDRWVRYEQEARTDQWDELHRVSRADGVIHLRGFKVNPVLGGKAFIFVLVDPHCGWTGLDRKALSEAPMAQRLDLSGDSAFLLGEPHTPYCRGDGWVVQDSKRGVIAAAGDSPSAVDGHDALELWFFTDFRTSMQEFHTTFNVCAMVLGLLVGWWLMQHLLCTVGGCCFACRGHRRSLREKRLHRGEGMLQELGVQVTWWRHPVRALKLRLLNVARRGWAQQHAGGGEPVRESSLAVGARRVAAVVGMSLVSLFRYVRLAFNLAFVVAFLNPSAGSSLLPGSNFRSAVVLRQAFATVSGVLGPWFERYMAGWLRDMASFFSDVFAAADVVSPHCLSWQLAKSFLFLTLSVFLIYLSLSEGVLFDVLNMLDSRALAARSLPARQAWAALGLLLRTVALYSLQILLLSPSRLWPVIALSDSFGPFGINTNPNDLVAPVCSTGDYGASKQMVVVYIIIMLAVIVYFFEKFSGHQRMYHFSRYLTEAIEGYDDIEVKSKSDDTPVVPAKQRVAGACYLLFLGVFEAAVWALKIGLMVLGVWPAFLLESLDINARCQKAVQYRGVNLQQKHDGSSKNDNGTNDPRREVNVSQLIWTTGRFYALVLLLLPQLGLAAKFSDLLNESTPFVFRHCCAPGVGAAATGTRVEWTRTHPFLVRCFMYVLNMTSAISLMVVALDPGSTLAVVLLILSPLFYFMLSLSSYIYRECTAAPPPTPVLMSRGRALTLSNLSSRAIQQGALAGTRSRKSSHSAGLHGGHPQRRSRASSSAAVHHDDRIVRRNSVSAINHHHHHGSASSPRREPSRTRLSRHSVSVPGSSDFSENSPVSIPPPVNASHFHVATS